MRDDAIAGVTISRKRSAAFCGRDASVYVSRWHTHGASVNLELFGKRAMTMYEAHPAFTRRSHVDVLAGRTLADIEAKITRAEASRILEGGTP